MGGRHHSRRLVNGKRNIVVATRRRDAAVHTHPDSNVPTRWPARGLQQPLSLGTGTERIGGIRERHEERVSRRGDLVPVVTRPCLAKEVAMLLQGAVVPLAKRAEQARRTLDVGEHEGDSTGRQFALRHVISLACAG
jgi:hypothetical protein